MSKSILFAIVLALGLVAGVGCSAVTSLLPTNPTATRVATAVPPTQAVRATITPAATLTPTLAPPGNLPQDLLNAITNTKAATSFRLEMTFNRTYTKLGKPVSDSGSWKAEENGADHHFTLTGTGFFSGTSASTFEMITANQQTFTKGITFTKSMDPNVWYQYPALVASTVTRTVSSGRTLLTGLKMDEFKPANLKATGVEVIDLLPCVVWTAQTPNAVKSFGSFGNADVERELKAVDKQDIRMWTCADGRLHQIKATIEGHDPAKPADKIKEDFTFHMFDFAAKIVISAPPNPQPFPLK